MAYNIFEGYVQDSWKVTDRLTVDLGLRLSHLGAWYERGGVGMAVFDPALYNAERAGKRFPGLTWTARDSSVPTSGINIQSVFLAPRAGFAYDLFGSGAHAAARRLRHLQLPRSAGTVLRLHRPALWRDARRR